MSPHLDMGSALPRLTPASSPSRVPMTGLPCVALQRRGGHWMERIPNLPFPGPWRPLYSSHPGSSAASPCPPRPLLQLRGAPARAAGEGPSWHGADQQSGRARLARRGGCSRCSSGNRGGWCANSETALELGAKMVWRQDFSKRKRERETKKKNKKTQPHTKQRSSVPAWVEQKQTQTIKKQELKSN